MLYAMHYKDKYGTDYELNTYGKDAQGKTILVAWDDLNAIFKYFALNRWECEAIDITDKECVYKLYGTGTILTNQGKSK